MKKIITKVLVLGFLFFVLWKISAVMLPSDILYTLPSFSLENWERPNNSLLADPLFQFEPWRIYSKESFANGDLPLWNDLNGAGAPFMANPQTQIFYPLNVLYYILPVEVSLIMIHLIKFFLFLFFTYVYLRAIKVSRTASVIGSIFASSGFMLLWLQWPHSNVYLLFPLLLFLTESITKSNKLAIFLCFSATYLIGFLGGHPETLFLTATVHSIYTFLRSKENILLLFASIIYAFFMSSFITFPFLEYLFNSTMFHTRSSEVFNHSIPLISVLFNFFPFLMGAPHLFFYKPLSGTNFQEALGGFTGLISLVLLIDYILKNKINKISNIWILIIIITFLFIYNIPFLTFLIQQSPLNISANHRLIAFMGFGIAVISSIALDKLIKRKHSKFKRNYNFLFIATSFLLITPLVFSIKNEYLDFYNYILPFIFVILISTFLFFNNYKIAKTKILIFLVVIQTWFLFLNYNTITKKELYYPETSLTNFLTKQGDIRVLEVGNPNMPPAINMPYGIEMTENNDALGIYSYDKEFEKAFPKRNHWRKVDDVDIYSLRKFGITHVVSDYDINLKKTNYQSLAQERLDLDKPLSFKISNVEGLLSQIRFITHNFNRLNNCHIDLIIYSENSEILSTKFECRNIRDGMFTTINFDKVDLRYDKSYEIELIPHNISTKNFVAIAGSDKKPYIDLLFENKNIYEKVFEENGVYVFKVPGSDPLITGGNYEALEDRPGRILIKLDTDVDNITINKANYPGWKVFINGRETKIDKKNAFITFSIFQGQNLIAINYVPTSFYIGFLISFLSIVFYIVILFRIKIVRSLIVKHTNNLRSLSLGKALGVKLVIVSIPLLFSFVILNFIYRGTKSNLSSQKLLVVNWFTQNDYPKILDYQFYLIAVLVIPIVVIAVYFLVLKFINKRK